MNNEQNPIVNVEQFVSALLEQRFLKRNLLEYTPPTPKVSDFMNYGYQAGWLEDMDVTGRLEPLLKKNAARIIHEFMRLELHEPDCDDVSASTMLRDLYDCRVCTKHVMQVYAKGIMKGYYASDTLYLFGMNEPVTLTEMDEIIFLVFEHKKL